MRSIRVPVGMSDVVILFGPERARERVVRTLARDTSPVTRTGPRGSFGEGRISRVIGRGRRNA